MDWSAFLPHIRRLPQAEQARVEHAFEMGKKAHSSQKRQSGEPYFTHPIAVATVLADMGADADTVIAALLHDTVEDTPLTLEDIGREFGPDVAHLVDGVTKLLEKDLHERPTLDERIETLRKMFNLMQLDARIMLIKLADRLHNMQTISHRSREKQTAVARETLEVYVKIADRLCMRALRDDLEKLCLDVLEPDVLPHLIRQQEEDEALSATVIPEMRAAVDPRTVSTMIYERKSWDGLLRQREQEKEGFSRRIINVAFVSDSVPECYGILGELHRHWKRETHTFEDYINAPLINGYQALHTTVILENGVHVRCKIRTKEMQEYAWKGISLFCFDMESLGVMHYLPWTKRIVPLSADTQDRSTDFWESLRSDILGESNIVHGEGDATQLLPKEATALDGVFYLYGERGLKVNHIYVNGKGVVFHEPLAYGDTLQATFSSEPQVQLKWLQYIRTGIGGAFVRQGLSQQDTALKHSMGQKILQDYLTDRRRGFISEFNRDHVESLLKKAGLPLLHDLYEQIAEGRFSPQEVENALFGSSASGEKKANEASAYTLTCTIPLEDRMKFLEELRYYTMKNFRLLDSSETHRKYRITLLLTPKELSMLSFSLDHLPRQIVYSLRRKSTIYKSRIASAVLVALWGLDPTVGYSLLQNPLVSSVDMTVIRFFSLTVLSGALFAWNNRHQSLRLVQISWKNSSLWLSALLLFLVSLSTYAALEDTSPIKYTIAMTCAGLFVTSLVNWQKKKMLIAMWLFVLTGLTTLVFMANVWPWQSVLFTFLAVVFFSLFSVVSERYKRREQVSQRWSQYFFALSTLCTVFSLALLPFSTLGDLTPNLLVSIIVFSIICTGIPYYIYYNLLSHKEIDFVLRYSFILIPTTLLTQVLLLGQPRWQTLLSGGFVIIGAIVPLLDQKLLKRSVFGKAR